MHKYSAHAATDVTGFGLIGHADNLAKFQKQNLKLQIEKLPIIKNVLKISQIVGQDTKLLSGKAVETSGGLLICLPKQNAEEFCKEYNKVTNCEQNAWVIGRVLKSDQKQATVVQHPDIIEV